jgi:hypothetical protein
MNNDFWFKKTENDILEAQELKKNGETQIWDYPDHCWQIDDYINYKKDLLNNAKGGQNEN